ncbi:MAG: PSD1 and planctomycete cytochrome C domain-containing protein [Planctomycetota bacterium]
MDKPKDEPILFNRDIRPILSENCFFCHGPDKKHQEADVRLDLFGAATRDLGGYAAIVPGNKEESESWLRMLDEADPMPPKNSNKKLTAEEIELIGRWIDQGAWYETHWSYAPVVKADAPDVKDEQWITNAIDRFILSELESRGIKPSPEADRRMLLRRVTLDLTGLPPTREQTKAFMSDASPLAYENYVDSLLAHETYGEHLAVWWLDLVRFADTIGFHSDNPKSVWPYRDWVIRSFNQNMPFDRFTTMQLAGDLMQDEPTQEMLIASAYIRLAPSTEEGGAQAKEYQAIYNADRVANYSDVFLGSSVACAQCHDHKFDPISIEDYYKLVAFFGDINQAKVSESRGYKGLEPPFIFVPQNEEQANKIAETEEEYQALIKAHPEATQLEEHLSSRSPTGPGLPGGAMPEYGERFKQLMEERRKLAHDAKITTVVVARDIYPPRTVRILDRGDWQDDTGEIVQPATPEFLGGPVSSEGNRLSRLDLAKWTVSPDNPLTGRVVVNRLWGRYLGSAISSNTIELGSQGIPPTHPDLLDYLASEFVETGWDLKEMIRLIVTSSTYKQSADTRDDLALIDPDNILLFARQSAIRLPAETIRDQALAVSGLMKPRIGGPSVFPYQPEGHWEPLNFPRRKYPTSKGDDLYRRSVYTWVQRTFPHPMLINFDATGRETCTGQRMVSNTPLQALTTLNGPTFVEAARVLAAKLITDYPTNEARLDALYQAVLTRTPRDNEKAALTKLLITHRDRYAKTPEEAAKLTAVGEAPVAENMDMAELAAWTSVCRVVLNLHETLTRN